MRIANIHLTAFRGISSTLDLSFDNNGKNLLVYGENGSAKSSFARALEHLFTPTARPDQDIVAHKNLFVPATPEIRVEFTGQKAGGPHSETVTWTQTSGKPTPAWLLSSAARSAFLDHRKLLMLSDRTHGNLPQRLFQTTVQHIFGSLPAGTSGDTVSSLWSKIQEDARLYRENKAAKPGEARGGIADPVAHYKKIEDDVNYLNRTLDDYLLPKAAAKPSLVVEAERLLGKFEGHSLTIDLRFHHLTFDRTDAVFAGGEINPEVTFCKKPLGAANNGLWVSTHHETLNEARLTALALSLFFSAVRLQDQIPYIVGTGDPTEPARLLVLDDILVGLDYDHRIPVLELIQDEFAAYNRYQVILLTHDRVWFDLCRLQLDPAAWKPAELFTRPGAGPDASDFPMRKQCASDAAARAQEFLNDGELPAAANYARTSIETSLKRICDKRRTPIGFTLNPERLGIDLFIDAAANEPKTTGAPVAAGTRMLVPKDLARRIRALRTTVLNPLSHAHPTTVTSTQVKRAIAVATDLVAIVQSL
jgi:energy-coupling factor transporter ATP-binding protein EcfA2